MALSNSLYTIFCVFTCHKEQLCPGPFIFYTSSSQVYPEPYLSSKLPWLLVTSVTRSIIDSCWSRERGMAQWIRRVNPIWSDPLINAVAIWGWQSEAEMLLAWTINTFYAHINYLHCQRSHVFSLTACLGASWVNWGVGGHTHIYGGESRISCNNVILNNASGHAFGCYLPNRASRQEAKYVPAVVMIRIIRKLPGFAYLSDYPKKSLSSSSPSSEMLRIW